MLSLGEGSVSVWLCCCALSNRVHLSQYNKTESFEVKARQAFHHIRTHRHNHSTWALYTLKSAIRKSKASPDPSRALRSRVQVLKQGVNPQHVCFIMFHSTTSYAVRKARRGQKPELSSWHGTTGRQNYRQGLPERCEDFGDSQDRKSCKCLTSPSCKNTEQSRTAVLGKHTYIGYTTHTHTHVCIPR